MSISQCGNNRFRPLPTQIRYGFTEPELTANGKPGIFKICNWQNLCWKGIAIFNSYPNIFACGPFDFEKSQQFPTPIN
jgi:hypothetical protein